MPNTEDKRSPSFFWMLGIFQIITKKYIELLLFISLEKNLAQYTFWKAGAQSNVTGMTKYILRKIYLGDGFGFNFFNFPALGVSVFTSIKNIQVSHFLMINMIVEFSLNFSATCSNRPILKISVQGDFQKLISPSKPRVDSSQLLNITKVVRTTPMKIFLWQVSPSSAITYSVPVLRVRTCSALPGPGSM